MPLPVATRKAKLDWLNTHKELWENPVTRRVYLIAKRMMHEALYSPTNNIGDVIYGVEKLIAELEGKALKSRYTCLR